MCFRLFGRTRVRVEKDLYRERSTTAVVRAAMLTRFVYDHVV